MQRLTFLLVPGVIAIALFIGISKFESISNLSDTEIESTSLDFDAYSEGINTVIFDSEGKISYTLQALKQVHYNDDTTEFEKPFIRLFQDGNSRWNIVANSGRILPDQTGGDSSRQTIELSGNVEAYSLGEFGNRTVMSTEKMIVDPHLETLETDLPVTFVTKYLQQSSIGMFADLKIDEIIFYADNRGSYAKPNN